VTSGLDLSVSLVEAPDFSQGSGAFKRRERARLRMNLASSMAARRANEGRASARPCRRRKPNPVDHSIGAFPVETTGQAEEAAPDV